MGSFEEKNVIGGALIRVAVLFENLKQRKAKQNFALTFFQLCKAKQPTFQNQNLKAKQRKTKQSKIDKVGHFRNCPFFCYFWVPIPLRGQGQGTPYHIFFLQNYPYCKISFVTAKIRNKNFISLLIHPYFILAHSRSIFSVIFFREPMKESLKIGKNGHFARESGTILPLNDVHFCPYKQQLRTKFYSMELSENRGALLQVPPFNKILEAF